MVVRMRWIRTALVVGLLASGAVSAQQDIPSKSFDTLRDVLSGVRDALWIKNDEYWHDGAFDRCIAVMRLITQMDPHDTECYSNAAWLMWSDLREADAEAFLREGLANNTGTYDLYLELGMYYYFRTRFEEAIPLFAACLGFDDAPFYARHMLAHAYEHAGYIGDAFETWIEAEAAEPDQPAPPAQIDRMMRGEPPSQVPQSTFRAIQQRIEEEGKRR